MAQTAVLLEICVIDAFGVKMDEEIHGVVFRISGRSTRNILAVIADEKFCILE